MDNNTRELMYYFEDIDNNEPSFGLEGELYTNSIGMVVLTLFMVPGHLLDIMCTLYCYTFAQVFNALYKLTNPLRYWINRRN